MSYRIIAAVTQSMDQGPDVVALLQSLFGPLLRGIVGIVAPFFLFNREIARFVQFTVSANSIAVVLYTPGIARSAAAISAERNVLVQ